MKLNRNCLKKLKKLADLQTDACEFNSLLNMGKKRLEIRTVNSDLNRVEKVQVHDPICHLVSKIKTPIRKSLIDRGVVRENLKQFDKNSKEIEENFPKKQKTGKKFEDKIDKKKSKVP